MPVQKFATYQVVAWIVLLMFLLPTMAAGCGPGEPDFVYQPGERAEMSVTRFTEPSQGSDDDSIELSEVELQRKVIYNGSVQLIVEDLKSTARMLRRAVQSSGGFISDQSMNRVNHEQPYGKWTVRIPVATFQGFLEQVEEMGQIQQQTIDAEEVTDQFVDLQARLVNEKKLEARILELFEKTGNKMNEIITVEKELARVREVIEKLEGRLRYLSDRTDLATVTVSMQQRMDEVAVVTADYQTRLKETWGTMIGGTSERLQNLSLSLIRWLPNLLVLTLIAIVCYLFRQRLVKLFFGASRASNS